LFVFHSEQGEKFKFHLVPSGILNQSVQCVVGNGVVVHLRGLLAELKALKDAGIDYQGRLHLSDRAHIVFDFHQQIDGYNEKQLAGLKGIGPAYSCKTQRNGLRVGDLQDMIYFEARLRSLAAQLERQYPGIKIDVDHELAYYKSIRDELLPLITDTIVYCNDALERGQNILIEGANATSKYLDALCFMPNPYCAQYACANQYLLLLPIEYRSVGPGLWNIPVCDLVEPVSGQRLHRPRRSPSAHQHSERNRQGTN
jgi:adenylosuccinate synthase